MAQAETEAQVKGPSGIHPYQSVIDELKAGGVRITNSEVSKMAIIEAYAKEHKCTIEPAMVALM